VPSDVGSERTAPDALRVLLLRASDTLGQYLPDPSQGTFETMRRELPGVLSRPVELQHDRFYSHFPKSAGHAEAAARASGADVIIVAAHSLAFSMPSLGARLVQLFGWRIGRWLERRIWEADTRARKGGLLAKVREPVRTFGSRVIGTALHATVEETIRDYSETIRRLVRIETADVIVVGTMTWTPDAEVALHQELNKGLLAACEKHRCTWVDRMAILQSLGADAFQTEREATSPLFHRKVADALMEAVGERGGR
jgi:nucleotide-binding universal stress UspA family protein